MNPCRVHPREGHIYRWLFFFVYGLVFATGAWLIFSFIRFPFIVIRPIILVPIFRCARLYCWISDLMAFRNTFVLICEYRICNIAGHCELYTNYLMGFNALEVFANDVGLTLIVGIVE